LAELRTHRLAAITDQTAHSIRDVSLTDRAFAALSDLGVAMGARIDDFIAIAQIRQRPNAVLASHVG
jgi:hypothetical protein